MPVATTLPRCGHDRTKADPSTHRYGLVLPCGSRKTLACTLTPCIIRRLKRRCDGGCGGAFITGTGKLPELFVKRVALI